LGAAYAFLEEGLAVKSFFSPSWPALGQLAHYGRWLGVNWLWVGQLVLQHAVISIAIPILIVSMVYPDRLVEPWAGPWRRRLLWVLLLASAALIYGLIPYRVPAALYLMCVVVTVALVLVAPLLPAHLMGLGGERRPSVPGPRPIWYLILGFLGVVAMYGLPQHLLIPAAADFLLLWVVAGGFGALVLAMSKRGRAWGDQHRLALAAGALGFYFAISPLRGGPIGVLVSLIGIGGLVWLARRMKRPTVPTMTTVPTVHLA
jgi:hypothetical protein